jgi:LPXTG-site transpeptidase (sortase) family protein
MEEGKNLHLKLINRLLLAAIILVNGYVIIAPLWPAFTYQIKTHTTSPLNPDDPKQVAAIDTSRNHLIIPALRLDEPILDGPNPRLVNKGVWRRPNTSAPGHGSNTVLVGHRFTYDGPATFYHLDKVQWGDKLLVAWKGDLYTYIVNAIKEVPANAIDIEDATLDERLTIYTCTPLWSTKNRLVITAALEKMP